MVQHGTVHTGCRQTARLLPLSGLLSGAKHTLRVTNGTILELNGKQYTGNEAEIPAGSPVTLTLTVNEDALTAGDVFSSWTLSPSSEICGLMETSSPSPCPQKMLRSVQQAIFLGAHPDAEGSPLLGLALVAVGGSTRWSDPLCRP